MTDKLTKLRENAPSIKTKGKPVYDYFYRERYLDKEVFFDSFFCKIGFNFSARGTPRMSTFFARNFLQFRKAI